MRQQIHTIQLRDAVLRQDNQKLERRLNDLQDLFQTQEAYIQDLAKQRDKDAEVLLSQEETIARIQNQPKDFIHLEEIKAENKFLKKQMDTLQQWQNEMKKYKTSIYYKNPK